MKKLKPGLKLTDFAKSLFDMPLLHEGALKCLSCQRIVLVGKCCDNRVYCKDEDRYAGYEVSKTNREGIFSVKMGEEQYFVKEESPGVLSLSLYRKVDDVK